MPNQKFIVLLLDIVDSINIDGEPKLQDLMRNVARYSANDFKILATELLPESDISIFMAEHDNRRDSINDGFSKTISRVEKILE